MGFPGYEYYRASSMNIKVFGVKDSHLSKQITLQLDISCTTVLAINAPYLNINAWLSNDKHVNIINVLGSYRPMRGGGESGRHVYMD